MTKYIFAVLILLASFVANASTCNPTCAQSAPNQGEKEVDLRLSNATNDTVITKLRIQAADGTKSVYSDTNVYIGLYQIAIKNNVVDAFCVDPFQSAIYSNSKYIESKLDATDFATAGAQKIVLAQTLYDNAYSTLATATDAVKAGFHIALWEIFFDDLEETEGNIKASTSGTKVNTDKDVLTAANSFLTALTDNNWKITNKYDLTFYKSVCNQDFLVAKLNPPSQIPAPAALPLLISSLVGFCLIRRRKSI